MIKVKICGITHAQDALWAANLGADFIGFNFYSQSPRKVSAKHAKDLASQIPPFVTVVGLFVDEAPTAIAKLVKSVPLKAVQLHGNESPEVAQAVKAMGVKVIKALRLEGPLDPATAAPYVPHVDYFLLDQHSPGLFGGTGQAFDWSWAERAGELGNPFFLAGGLNATNVAKGVSAVHPFGVDVCSGVERTQTRKDYDAMKAFIQAARSAK